MDEVVELDGSRIRVHEETVYMAGGILHEGEHHNIFS